jgi:hypothetical protein
VQIGETLFQIKYKWPKAKAEIKSFGKKATHDLISCFGPTLRTIVIAQQQLFN